MQAIIVPSAGATPEIVSNVPIPEPGEGQILVKALYTAINPVDNIMAATGAMVAGWPFTPGCDVAGTIIALGSSATSAMGEAFKEGDHVFGCTRLGAPGHGAWAEYLLYDAALCIPVPENLNIASAAASGVGAITAGLGVYSCLGVPLPDAENLASKGDPWAIVFGGAGSVGQFAVQYLSIAGFKVIATGSKASFELLKNIGASAVVNYKQTPEEIIKVVKATTSGNLTHAFDAAGMNNDLLSALFSELASSTSGDRNYTTTNAFEPLPVSSTSNPFTGSAIQLGPIGQPEATELNSELHRIIPAIHMLLEKGLLTPNAYREESQGIQGILKAWDVQKKGNTGNAKIVIKIADN